MKKIKVLHECGISRQTPWSDCEYMQAYLQNGDELYAEILIDNYGEHEPVFESLKNDIIAQARTKGIPEKNLIF